MKSTQKLNHDVRISFGAQEFDYLFFLFHERLYGGSIGCAVEVTCPVLSCMNWGIHVENHLVRVLERSDER